MPLDPVPDDATASPADGHWFDEDTQWYRPSWSQTAALVGWRWILCLPLAALVALLVLLPGWTVQILINGWKLIVFAIAVPLAGFASAARNAVRNRRDPFCIHCGYSLIGLPDGHRCPDCGEPFRHALIDEYRRDPDFFIQRHKALQSLPPPLDTAFNAGPVRRKRRSNDGT